MIPTSDADTEDSGAGCTASTAAPENSRLAADLVSNVSLTERH